MSCSTIPENSSSHKNTGPESSARSRETPQCYWLTETPREHGRRSRKERGLRSRLDRSKPLVRPRSSRLTRRQNYYGNFSGPTSKSTLMPESETCRCPPVKLGHYHCFIRPGLVHVNLIPKY